MYYGLKDMFTRATVSEFKVKTTVEADFEYARSSEETYMELTLYSEVNGIETKVLQLYFKKDPRDWSWSDRQTVFNLFSEHVTRHSGSRKNMTFVYKPKADLVTSFGSGDEHGDVFVKYTDLIREAETVQMTA